MNVAIISSVRLGTVQCHPWKIQLESAMQSLSCRQKRIKPRNLCKIHLNRKLMELFMRCRDSFSFYRNISWHSPAWNLSIWLMVNVNEVACSNLWSRDHLLKIRGPSESVCISHTKKTRAFFSKSTHLFNTRFFLWKMILNKNTSWSHIWKSRTS